MSRKHDRQMKINEGIRDVLESEDTMKFLVHRIIRRKPWYFPRFAWKWLMYYITPPSAKKPIRNT